MGQQLQQRQQQMMVMQEAVPQQQIMMMQPVGFRQNSGGMQWNSGTQQHQDWMDMSMAGNNSASLRFSQ